MSRIILLTIIAVFLSGCTSKVAKQTLEKYNQVFERVLTLEKLIFQTDFQTLSGGDTTARNQRRK